jgi:hypothetical protein
MGAVSQSPSGLAVFSEGVSPDEVRQQLDRILRSDAFSRSRRSQAFLSYITQLAIAGEESTINEHMIGIEVFGRGPNYNPGEDGVVRRQAHSLRQRLEAYYKSEGQDDPILIDVPVGHYVPVFGRRTIEGDKPAVAPLPRAAETLRRLPVWTWIALIVFVSVAAYAVGRRQSRAVSADARLALNSPALHELWQLWLTPGQSPVICFSSPYGAVVKHYLTQLPAGSQPPRLQLNGDIETAFRSALRVGDSGFLYVQPTINDAKSGEALGGVLLANFFGMWGLKTGGTLSRLMNWEEFRQQNLILLGHSEQNRWVAPLLEDYPLRLEETNGDQRRRVVNVQPQTGEPKFFEIDYALHEDEATVEYALVSMLPGTDRRHQLLIVSGLNTQATLMGIEFLTDPGRAQSLLDRMRALSPRHSGPWHFQLVLRTEVREKVPTGDNMEMLRVLDSPPPPSPDDAEPRHSAAQ